MVTFRYRSPRQLALAQQSQLLVQGALAALSAAIRGAVPNPPGLSAPGAPSPTASSAPSMLAPTSSGGPAFPSLAPPASPSPPSSPASLPAPGNVSALASALTGGTDGGVTARPSPPSVVTPPLATPPLLARGGVLLPGPSASAPASAPAPASALTVAVAGGGAYGDVLSAPATETERLPSPDEGTENVVPNHILFEIAAKRLLTRARDGWPAPGGSVPAVSAGGTNSRTNMEEVEATGTEEGERTSEREASRMDAAYIASIADAPPAPARFLAWLVSPEAETSATGKLLARAYRNRPELADMLFAAARDIAAEAPGELPAHVRALFTREESSRGDERRA